MARVSLRTIVMDVPPQDIITRDNVSVKVNAVVYFRVIDPRKAIVEVESYHYATSQLAQTTLRSVLGQVELDDLLSERERLNAQLQEILDQHTEPWGVKVASVEVKQVDLPPDMQRAMAKQAEAEREKRAKIVHAAGELEASVKLAQAATAMAVEPMTITLRYLQTLTEIASEKNSTIIFPLPIELLEPAADAKVLIQNVSEMYTTRRAAGRRGLPRDPAQREAARRSCSWPTATVLVVIVPVRRAGRAQREGRIAPADGRPTRSRRRRAPPPAVATPSQPAAAVERTARGRAAGAGAGAGRRVELREAAAGRSRPPAEKLKPPSSAPAAPAAAPATAAKPVTPPAETADARTAAKPAATAPTTARPAHGSSSSPRCRIARAANAIVRRLAAKGYPAFVLDPAPGSPVIYRVQVGGYPDRDKAEQAARRLEKEEQFKPYVRVALAWLDFALALLSGALLALSFPKFGHPAFAWIALAPLLVAVAHRRQPVAPQRSRSACSPAPSTSPGTLYWLVETMTTFGGLSTPTATFAAAMLIAYLSLFPAAFAVIQARLVRALRPPRAAARARHLGGDRDGSHLRARRLPVGAARLQPGDACCRSRRSPASSASTACRRWSRSVSAAAAYATLEHDRRGAGAWPRVVALVVLGHRGLGHACASAARR